MKKPILIICSLLTMTLASCTGVLSGSTSAQLGNLVALDSTVAMMIRDEALRNRGNLSTLASKQETASKPSDLFGKNVYYLKDQYDISASMESSTEIGTNFVSITKSATTSLITDSKGSYSSTTTSKSESWIDADPTETAILANFAYATTVVNGVESVNKTTTSLDTLEDTDEAKSQYVNVKVEQIIFPDISAFISSLNWYSNSDQSIIYGISSTIVNGTYNNPYDGSGIISATANDHIVQIIKDETLGWVFSSIKRSTTQRILYSPEGEILTSPITVTSVNAEYTMTYAERTIKSHTIWDGSGATDVNLPVLNSFHQEDGLYMDGYSMNFTNRTAEYTYLHSSFTGSYFELRSVSLYEDRVYAFSTTDDMLLETPNYIKWGYHSLNTDALYSTSGITLADLPGQNLIALTSGGYYTITIKLQSNGSLSEIIMMADTELGLR